MGGESGLYGDLSSWWHNISDPADYDEEAALLADAMEETAHREIRDVLELGSGGGNNAVHMKNRFNMTLVDLAPGMVEVSRRLNPECEHVVGDMRTVRLGRAFDAVFVHDAVVYMLTEEDLLAAMTTAREHLRPGGVALFVPDHIEESFTPGVGFGGGDGDGRSLRFLQWTNDPDPNDGRYRLSFAFLIREGDGEVRTEFEDHEAGLFPRSVWLERLARAGLLPLSLPYEGSTFEEPVSPELFLGLRAHG